MSYIPGHEHYLDHNNWKRGFVESAVSSYSATDSSCGDGHGYDKPNSLDVGFNISNKTFLKFYNVGSNGCSNGSSGFLPNLLRGFAGNSCCGTNSNIGWFGRATGTLLNLGLKFGLTSWLMNKYNNVGSMYSTGLGGGGYQFIPTSWTGGGSSIFGSGFGGGYAGTGDMLINSTGMLPWKPVPYSGVGNSGNGTGDANGTGGANNNNGTNTDNNSQGVTPQNNNNQTTPPSNANNDGSGNGTGSVISANDFNNAIDDLASDGKTTKLYYGIAQNTNESMKGYLEKTESKHGDGVDEATQKRGIRAGKANEAAGKETKDKQDGYYKYITLTDGTSNNEYTYTFVSAKDGKLTYKLSKDYTDTSKDDNGDDKGWEGTGAEPEVVIRIKDGVIYLESSGTDYSATKKSAKQA